MWSQWEAVRSALISTKLYLSYDSGIHTSLMELHPAWCKQNISQPMQGVHLLYVKEYYLSIH